MRNGLATMRRHPIVMVPMLIAIVILILGSMAIRDIKLGFTGSLLQMAMMMALCIYAHGVTVAMTWDARKHGSTSLNAGALIARQEVLKLLPISILIGLMFALGIVLLLVPSLAVLLFFMFSMSSMIVRNQSAFDSLIESIIVVRSDFRNSMLMFVMLSFTGLLLLIVSSISNLTMPVIGVFVSMALWVAFTTTASVIALELYLELSYYEN